MMIKFVEECIAEKCTVDLRFNEVKCIYLSYSSNVSFIKATIQ